jgi:hypothetical protein
MLANLFRQYSPVPSAGRRDSSEAFISKAEGDEQPVQCRCQQAMGRGSQLGSKAVAMAILITLLIINLAFVIGKYRPSDKACTKQLSSYCRAVEYLILYVWLTVEKRRLLTLSSIMTWIGRTLSVKKARTEAYQPQTENSCG